MKFNVASKDICSNCGKTEAAELRNCSACRLVKYCSVDCQRAHRNQHKKACKQRAAELEHDRKLFGSGLVNKETCPVCFLKIPVDPTQQEKPKNDAEMIAGLQERADSGSAAAMYELGIKYALGMIHEEDYVSRKQNRSDEGDAPSKFQLGIVYMDGEFGMPKNTDIALQLWNEAADLGHTESKFRLGAFYEEEDDDVDRAIVLYEEAAMEGHIVARYKLGCIEVEYGCSSRAVRHFAVGAKMGNDDCLNALEAMTAEGDATAKEYEDALDG
ncbi:hypothetical protein THAOC_23596, partial [Thalassiosira oceanica]